MCFDVAVRIHAHSDVNTLGTAIGRLFYLNDLIREIPIHARKLIDEVYKSEFPDRIPQDLSPSEIRALIESETMTDFMEDNDKAEGICQELMSNLLNCAFSQNNPNKVELKKALAQATSFALTDMAREIKDESCLRFREAERDYESKKNNAEAIQNIQTRDLELARLEQEHKQKGNAILQKYLVSNDTNHYTLNPFDSEYLMGVCNKLDDPKSFYLISLIYQSTFWTYEVPTIPHEFQDNLLTGIDHDSIFKWLNHSTHDFEKLDNKMHLRVECFNLWMFSVCCFCIFSVCCFLFGVCSVGFRKSYR